MSSAIVDANGRYLEVPDERGSPDPFKGRLLVIGLLFVLTLPMTFLMVLAAKPEPPQSPFLEVAQRLGVPAYRIHAGRAVFQSSCALCHGENGEGKIGLGKPLRNSAYVQEHTDEELFSVISQGRLPDDPENTTGQLMPARGAQALSDQALWDVILYLRAMQDPTQPPTSLEDWIVRTVQEGGAQQQAGLVGEQAGIGHDLFVASCSACHGANAEGMPGLGKPLKSSEFVANLSDDELIAFVKQGRPIWDPNNTTGVDMPPKGGNPALSDEQLKEIVRYLRSIHD